MRASIVLKHLFLLTFTSLSFNLFAQNTPVQKKNYALLWEITGNGLTKHSYLFGTMHLRDKRVFEFSDSMLIKLADCDAFASEVRMDSAVYQSFESSVRGDTTNNLKRKLSKQGYARLLNALKSRGINVDSLNNKNSAAIHNKFTDRDEEDTDESKDLFLDLYLTRMAYNQGKALHGLETLDDYEDLNDSFLSQFEDSTFLQKDTSFLAILSQITMLEDMIEVYNQGDLDGLQKIIRGEKAFNGNRYKREMLDNRNLKMVKRLEDLMRQKSVFCAVGAAHLPDSMGLITLLREKGYTLRKVTPQFTGMAEQFKPKTIERPKYHLKDEFNHVELDFPDEPYLVNRANGNRRTFGSQYVYYDITTGAIHFAETDFHLVDRKKKMTKEKAVDAAFTQWLAFRSFKNIKKEKFTLGDNEGIKFSATMPSKALIKGQFIIANNSIYKTIVFFDKHKSDDTGRAEAFLNSLKINPLPLTDWQIFEDEKGAFSLKVPSKPEFQELKTNIADEGEDPLNYYSNLFVSKELESGFTYMVRYSDMPSGRHIENDSTYLSKIAADAQSRFKKTAAKVEIDSLTRHYGSPEFNLKISIEGMTLFMRNILRGNRLYMLLCQPPYEKNKANNKKSEDWLNSFRFLPFSPPKLTQKSFPEMGVSLGLPSTIEPSKMVVEKGDFPSKTEQIVRATDNQTSGIVMASKTIFSDYYNGVNVDSFWNKYTRVIESADNSFVKATISDTLFRNLKAKLVTLDYLQSQNTFKSIVVLKDGFQYEFSLILPYEIANDAYASQFYNAIEFTENADKKDIYSDKKTLIINDLASSIDSVNEEAKIALGGEKWLKTDLPILIDALQKKYADDTLDYDGTRLILLDKMTNFKDVATLNALEKLAATTAKDTFIQRAVLCAFLNLDTLASANRFFDVVKGLEKPNLDDYYCLNSFMRDSIERAKMYFEKMLSVSTKPFSDNQIIAISANISEQDTLHLMDDIFKKYTPQYLADANELLDINAAFLQKDTIGDDESDAYYLLYNYTRFFKNVPNTREINQFLRKISNTKHINLLSQAIQGLVKNEQPVSGNLWQQMGTDKSSFYYLLSDLKRDSFLSKVPPQYINQKDVAEGIILGDLEEEGYGESKEFKWIETQKYKVQTLYIFRYKIEYEDEEPSYIFAVCAQPLDKNKFDLAPELVQFSEITKETKNYKKIVSELLKNHEKDVETMKGFEKIAPFGKN